MLDLSLEELSGAPLVQPVIPQLAEAFSMPDEA